MLEYQIRYWISVVCRRFELSISRIRESRGRVLNFGSEDKSLVISSVFDEEIKKPVFNFGKKRGKC